MVKSMTGFGKSILELPEKSVSIEIKSLNSKQFDANLRLPGIYREKEAELRLLLSSKLGRGKIELNINVDDNGESTHYNFNRAIAKLYYKEMKELASELNIGSEDQIINTLVRMPDVLKAEQAALSEKEWSMVNQTVLEAIEKLNTFRIQEGSALEKDLAERVEQIEQLLLEIVPWEEKRIINLKERILKQLDESMSKGVDMNRFEQEIIYYLEKLDITEEKVRLKKHCQYFLETLSEDDANGKKLGFISQEMGREINTLGSKANDADIQKKVVLMKDELEKIKEQLFNIL